MFVNLDKNLDKNRYKWYGECGVRHTNNLETCENTVTICISEMTTFCEIDIEVNKNIKISPAADEGFRLNVVLIYYIGLHMYVKV